jgi:hypothetical protein
MSITGGCRCGNVRYVLNMDAPPTVYACHCTDCQTWSGSAFTENFLVAREALEVSGPLVSWEYTSASGAQATQQFCGSCYTRLFNITSRLAGMAVMRAGTLDQSDQLSPVAHIWVSRKQPWVAIPAGIPTWPKTPTPEEFAAALATRQR